MFRPIRESMLLKYIPFRVIIYILLIFSIIFSASLVLHIQHEKKVVEELVKLKEKEPSHEILLPFLEAREDVMKITVVLFLLGAIGLSFIVMYENYYSTKRALEQVKSLSRIILQSIPSGVITIDEKGMITSINPPGERTLALNGSAALGQHFSRVFKEGNGIGPLLQKALIENAFVQDSDIAYEVAGSRTMHIRISTSPLKDLNPRPSGIVLLIQDVSELASLEQQVRRADKLLALHTLSAGIAHEIRNPLSAIDLNLNLLAEEASSDTPMQTDVEKYLRILNSETKRLKEIVDTVLRFSQPSELKLGEVKIPQILQHIIALVSYEAAEKNIRIEKEPSLDIPSIVGDETQLSQAFLNIVINALQAMPHGGLLRVASRIKNRGKKDLLEITFSDTGVGISGKELPRIFEPFYSTKKGGTGLGLAVAHRIVEDHKGTITIESREGEGTSVTVSLSAALRSEIKGE